MSEDKLVEEFRLAGRLLALGIRMTPRLPRSQQAMQTLKREAVRDENIRRALEASVAKAERTRQLEPQTIRRRNSGTVLGIS